jgi:hypothetical protein
MGTRAGRHRPQGCRTSTSPASPVWVGCPADRDPGGRGVATYAVRLLARPSAVTRADRAPPARPDAGASHRRAIVLVDVGGL